MKWALLLLTLAGCKIQTIVDIKDTEGLCRVNLSNSDVVYLVDMNINICLVSGNVDTRLLLPDDLCAKVQKHYCRRWHER